MWKHERAIRAVHFRICLFVTFFSLVGFSCPLAVHADDPQRADDIAMAAIFSFREATQVHLLAHALGTAALNGTPSEEVVKHCERAIDSYKNVSLPILRKYLANVDHDWETRETFSQIQLLQQRALAEVQAIKAMAESGNAQAERLAFVEANRAYSEAAQQVVARVVKDKTQASSGDEAAGQGKVTAIQSPNRRVLSDESWGEIADEFVKKGFARDPADAAKFFGTVGMLKQVFVEKRIPDPSPKQLFGLAKVLNIPFHQMTPEKIETTLATMLRLAKETGTEVASREALLKMEDE